MRLLGSYKAQVLLLTAAFLLVPVIGVFVLVLVGKASIHDFVELAKWAAGGLGLTGTGTVLGRALEGMAEKGATRDVTAGGDVTIESVESPLAIGSRETKP